MKKLFLCLLLLGALLLLPAISGAASQAQDITAACEIRTSGGNDVARLYDRQYTTRWTGRERRETWIECTTDEATPAGCLYVCFAVMPDEWRVETQVDDEWVPLVSGGTDYMHTCVELGGVTHFRLWARFDKAQSLIINELFVLGEGDLPSWVQVWEPAPEKADLLVLAAHPDDELIYFGGLLPTYATEQGKKTVVVYMTDSNTTRMSELLNGLWEVGVHSYPVIGPFYDGYSYSLEEGYRKWPKAQARAFVMEQIRRYRPDVVVSHDVNGEYGHGAHRVCADVALYCVQNCMRLDVESESAAEYGLWTVQKLYLHLYGDDPLELDWNVPLSSLGGRTGLQAAQDAYALHVTQQNTNYVVTDEGPYSCALFGLAYTTVGKDVARNDLFENVVPGGVNPSAYATPAPEHIDFARPEVTCEWPASLACERDALGYPVAGEQVLWDEEAGLWFYASPSLVVRIDRFFDQEGPITWYEAEVFADTSVNRFGSVLFDPSDPERQHVQPARIATENQVVFGMNTDYYTYRTGRGLTVGIIIRGGEVLYDDAPKTLRDKFPNLDTLAMFSNGDWDVFDFNAHIAEDYLRMGAVDVFSFGPWLFRGEDINPYVVQSARGVYNEPRCAVGMYENGHYVAVVVEGRMGKESVGISLPDLCELMRQTGCTLAINLDGGQTAAFTFMGQRITRVGTYSGGRTYPRTTTELIGIGRSDLIDPTAETE